MDKNKHIEGNEHLKLNNEDKLSACLDRFLKDGASNSVMPTPTGFQTLDDILDGGLYEGVCYRRSNSFRKNDICFANCRSDSKERKGYFNLFA